MAKIYRNKIYRNYHRGNRIYTEDGRKFARYFDTLYNSRTNTLEKLILKYKRDLIEVSVDMVKYINHQQNFILIGDYKRYEPKEEDILLYHTSLYGEVQSKKRKFSLVSLKDNEKREITELLYSAGYHVPMGGTDFFTNLFAFLPIWVSTHINCKPNEIDWKERIIIITKESNISIDYKGVR
ncbi:MAG: hypothetical protein ISS82_01565 [Nanoarchaeota archaeon]|nr:hypothetical protein [Nanoarchaeota archaeon]